MVKKEFRELILPALLRLSIIIIPIILMIIFDTSKEGEINVIGPILPFWAFSTLWIANNFGTQAFKSEFNDNAFEYLLSWPRSKLRFISYKLLPRLVLILLLIAIYVCLYRLYLQKSGHPFFILSQYFIPVIIIFFLFVGFFISLIGDRSKRAMINFLVFICYIMISFGTYPFISKIFHNPIIIHNPDYKAAISSILGAILIIILLGFAFFSVLRRFDLRSLDFYLKQLTLKAIVPMLFLALLSIFVMVKIIKIS